MILLLSTSIDWDMTYTLCYSLIIIHVRAESAILTVMFWLEAEQMDILLWYEYLPTIGRV